MMRRHCHRAAAALALLGLFTLSAASVAGPRGCMPTRDGRLVCPPPDGRCVPDRLGEVVCSTEGGGIRLDRLGEPVCGPRPLRDRLEGRRAVLRRAARRRRH